MAILAFRFTTVKAKQLISVEGIMASETGNMTMDPGETAVYAVVVVLLVLGAGLMSGLTLGLLSLDVMDLEVRANGSPVPRVPAAAASLVPAAVQQTTSCM